MKFDDNKRIEVLSKLKEKMNNSTCPVCKSNNFTLLGMVNHAIQTNTQVISVGGQSIPAAIIACNVCGFLMEFSLGILGVLTKD